MWEMAHFLKERKRVEVDFVANMGSKRYYIQSSLSLGSESKAAQEKRPLLAIQDSFKKILIVQDSAPPHYDEQGILILSIKDFLLNPDSLME